MLEQYCVPARHEYICGLGDLSLELKYRNISTEPQNKQLCGIGPNIVNI